MTAADNIRNNIIDRLLAINDRSYLQALYLLIERRTDETDVVRLSKAQVEMLGMSEEDIALGRVVKQEDLDRDDMIWLQGR